MDWRKRGERGRENREERVISYLVEAESSGPTQRDFPYKTAYLSEMDEILSMGIFLFTTSMNWPLEGPFLIWRGRGVM